MPSTTGQLIGLAQEKVKMDRTTIGLPGVESTHLIHVVDQADREFNRKFKVGGGEPVRSVSSERGGTLSSNTSLDADVLQDATTFSVDSATNAVDAGGAAAIWDENMPDIVEYTDGSTTTISGVTLLDFDHDDGDQVQWLPVLPSNHDTFRGTDDNPHGIWVDGVPFSFVSGVPYGTQYRLYDNGTLKYLLFPRGLTGKWFARYNKKGTTIDEESDNVTVPEEYEDFIVFRVVEHIYFTLDHIVFERAAARAKIVADRILLDALKLRNIGKSVRLGRSVEISSDYDRHSRLYPDTSV